MIPTVIRNYVGLVSVWRARADELSMTREDIDAGASLQPGYASKMLTLPPIKSAGEKTFGPTLAQLRMVLIAVPEEMAPTLMDTINRPIGGIK